MLELKCRVRDAASVSFDARAKTRKVHYFRVINMAGSVSVFLSAACGIPKRSGHFSSAARAHLGVDRDFLVWVN